MSSPRRQGSGRQLETVVATDEKSSFPKVPRSPTSRTIPSSQAPSSPMNFDFRKMINSQDLLEMAACPCCQQQCIDEQKQQTITGGPRMIADPYTIVNDDGSIDSDDEETLPRGVAEGLNYHPKKILVEGWLHKKGTGKDWLGSKSWKPRWARLVVSCWICCG